MNNRLKHLREILKLSQNEFSEQISIARSTLSLLEKGDRILQDRHIKLICQTFNVNEDWLRNGTEPIFKEQDALEDFFNEKNASPLARRIIKKYFNLNEEHRKMFENFLQQCILELEEEKEQEDKSHLLSKEEFAGRIGITSAEIMEAFKNNKDIFNNKKEAL